MEYSIQRRIPTRAIFVLSICLIAWVTILIRLFSMQILHNQEYRQKVEDNIYQNTSLNADRGIIYDQNGNVLAQNVTTWRVFLSPKDITSDADAQKIAEGLSQVLGLQYDTVYKKATQKWQQDVTVARSIGAELKEQILAFINENSFRNEINLEASVSRYYPYSSLAAHTIGFCGTDGGLSGLEYKYNEYLSGRTGQYIYAKNATGQSLPFLYSNYLEAQDGADLHTTIDATIQGILERQLEQTYRDSQATNRVTGIVTNVKTGAILAMATYPDFDLNDPFTLNAESQAKLESYVGDDLSAYKNELLYQMWNNKAIADTYEPGSTFKIITSAMALEEGVVRTNESFSCSGSLRVPGWSKAIHCHKRTGHGTQTFDRMLQQSCNPTMMTIAARVGSAKFFQYFSAFGYTQKTGIDLPSEARSIYHTQEELNQVELAVSAFGQTFRITPLQQIAAVSAIANGGYLLTPHLMDKIVTKDGEVIASFTEQKGQQVVSSEVCQTLWKILADGVSGDGGAKNAYVPGYEIAAKTGTSEVRDKLDENGNASYRIGSCVAFAPASDPEIAVIIIVDEPQCTVKYGSMVAAPYISAFLNEALPALGIERVYTSEERAKLCIEVGDYTTLPTSKARQNVASLGVDCTVIGEGDTVLKQIPQAGSVIQKLSGRIILITEENIQDDMVTVPNVIGKTAMEANQILINAGFNLSLSGALNFDVGTGALVVDQTPSQGLLPRGSVISLTLRFTDGTE